MTLRPYQLEAVEAIQKAWQDAAGVLLTMATGLGKTQVFCELLDRVVGLGRGLVLVHRKELVEQARDRLLAFWPHWEGRSGIVMAERDECAAQVVFATVQTLSSERRLARLLEHGPVDVLVTDEAHHSAAASYQAVYDTLQAANPGLRHLGVTATPRRADGVGLRSVFSVVAGSYDIRFGVRERYLVPPRWLAIQTGISLAQVATRYADGDKDYSARQLANVYETANCFDLVVASHQHYAAERQAVAFTVSVEGARQLAEAFRSAGVAAAAASAETDKTERRRILDDFRARRLQVLCNVGLYTEGLDVPEVACIHQVRPTQSDGLYLQMVGRALRLFPGKADALILDYAPLEAREVVMLGDVLGTAARKDVYLAEANEPGMVQGGFTFDGEFRWLQGSPIELISRQLNYLDLSPWRWHRADDGWLTLGLGRGGDEIERILALSRPDGDGRVALFALWRRCGEYGWQHRELGRGDLDTVQQQAEGLAEKHATQILSGKGRAWNAAPPTEGQLKFARRLRIAAADAFTRGELANRINHALAMQTLKGAGVAL